MSSSMNQTPTEAPLGRSQIIEPQNSRLVEVQREKLYGRSVELESLQKVSRSVPTSPQLVVLSGGSGTGKTVLANTPRSEKGMFCMGKHDPWLGNSGEMPHFPYAAWIAILNELAPQIQEKKHEIQQALDAESQTLLLQMVPALHGVLSQSSSNPEDASSAGNDSRNRFVFVVRKLLTSVSSQQNRVTILLDDLHWADSSSLTLMETIVLEVPTVLVVATCREDQLSSDSQVCESLRRLEDMGAKITNIPLQCLSQNSIQDMIQDKFHFSSEKHASLIDLVWSHTSGNPFFVKEFIQFLQDNELIQFNGKIWEWHSPRDDQFDTVHGDVLHLLQDKLRKLNERTLHVLQVASCLGSEIFSTLLECHGSRSVDVQLREAADKGLIYLSYGNCYRFSHDRIQQAVYKTIASPDELHLQIGRNIWKKLSEENVEKFVFVILNQVSLGLHLIHDQQERYRVASICLLAGRKAAHSSDFRAASRHLSMGISLLGGDSHWTSQYQLSLNIYNAAAEVEYAVGNMEGTDAHVKSVLCHATRFPDKLTAYSTQVYSYGSRRRTSDAVVLGLEVLGQLGVRFPSKPNAVHVLLEYARIKWLLRRKSKESLLRLPIMKVQEKLAAMQMMSLLFIYCYISRPDLLPLLLLRMFRLTLENGICAQSALGFVGYGTFLCGMFGLYKEAYDIGQVALKVLEMFPTKAFLPRVYAMYYGTIHHWRNPVAECLDPFRRGQEVAMETGDVEFAATNSADFIFYSFYARESLSVLIDQAADQIKTMVELKQETWIGMLSMIHQMALNYMGEAEDPLVLTGTACNQEALLKLAEDMKSPSFVTFMHMIRMELGYVFCEFEFAEQMTEVVDNVESLVLAAYDASESLFVQGMVHLALANKGSRGRRRRIRKGRRIIRQMKKWAHTSPHNWLSKLFLLQAEYSVVLKNYDVASAKFLAAIALAIHEGNVFVQALAEERMGRCFLQQSDQDAAYAHLREARSAYERWGASGKVKHMEGEFPKLVS